MTKIPEEVAWTAVCSARPRPQVQRGAKGHQWWKREVYHIRHPLDAELTLCGRDCSEWLTIGHVVIDSNCCSPCAAKTEPGAL